LKACAGGYSFTSFTKNTAASSLFTLLPQMSAIIVDRAYDTLDGQAQEFKLSKGMNAESCVRSLALNKGSNLTNIVICFLYGRSVCRATERSSRTSI
jgi:hypothetical protein